MSEMTSVVETQQQQQYVGGGSSSTEHHCKDCGLNFESETSLEVHLRYKHKNLLNQWRSKAQQEESNNNHSKAGNHNSHVTNANRDSVAVPADSSEPLSMSPSQDPISSQQQQPQPQPQLQPQQSQQQPQQQQQQGQQQSQQSQQQPGVHAIVCQPYEHFPPMFSDTSYFMSNEQSYMMSHHFSPQPEDAQSNGGRDSGGAYSRYLYPHQQHYSAERAAANSNSPRSSLFQCDKCGAVYEDANQLGEHVRTNHLDSPSTYSAPQYQPLGNSPQQQGQQLHPSPPLSNQAQQPPGYDYNGGQTIKEMKQEPEEQAEILDLDSHKVQTHKYEEELMRLQQQQQQQQGLQMQMHQQMQQQRIGTHSVSSMLGWPPATQTHDYHVGLPPMGTVDNVPPMTDQSQFIRGQHMPVEHGHQGSSIITSTQSMTSHQMPSGFVQQSQKATSLTNQSWKSNEARRPKTYNCTACNKWFTSSGHLKRHYNTTLHKNAVKNGKDPDPANLPISVHHHPGRDNNPSASGRGSGATTRSPSDLSSRSPPNLMAGPSGEATGGLLHTPTTLCNSNSNSSSSNSDSSAAVLVQQQQQQQLAVHLPHSGIMPLNSPGPSPLTGHHQQQMSSAPHQLALQQQQQQQQQLHLSTGSSGQPVHHTTSHSPMPPPPSSHMNCPSPMHSSSHPHHMNTPGSVTPVTSPTGMGGTTMPHQPYPNALPPHVITTTSIPAVLLESIPPVTTIQLTTIGNKEDEQPQQQHEMNMLPGFGTIEQKILPSFTQFGVTGFVVEQNQLQTVNVGGLTAEEITPQETSYESSQSYEPYSPAHYKSINVGTMQSTDNITNIEDGAHCADSITYQMEQLGLEANNNNLAKEDMDPNITKKQPKKGRKTKPTKKCQYTTTGANFISKEGYHKCIDCNKFFNKACYLTQHNKSFHSGDKPFKCAQCGKRFHNEESHGKHVLMHGKTRRHQCDSCPKIFAHRTDLKRHLCIHTGKRPFICETCNKGFIRQDHMKKHQQTHIKKARIENQRMRAQQLGYVTSRLTRC